MNKLILAIGITILLLLTACGTTTPTTGDQNVVQKTTSTIKDFITKGGAYKCESSITTPEGTAKQVAYVNGDTTRGELSNSNQPGTMIVVSKKEGTKQCSLIWTVGVPLTADNPTNEVLKTCYEATAQTQANNPQPGSGKISSIDMSAEANCAPYVGTIDTTPPADYKIMDLSAPVVPVVNIPQSSSGGDNTPVEYNSSGMY